MGRIPAPERGSYEWRQRDRMLSRYLSVRDAEEGTPERREARRLEDRLTRRYEALVGHALGSQMDRVPPNLEVLAKDDDLRTVGLLGLVRALRTWKPERGRTFAGYALQMVRWEMIHELRRLDGLRMWTRQRVTAAIRAAQAVEARTGRTPTEEEAAREAGITAGRYRELVGLDRLARDTNPLPAHDGPHNPTPHAEREGFEVGEVEVQERALWLIRYAGERCAREVCALYAAGEWGEVGAPEAWRNDRSVERGTGLASGLYELPEAGGSTVLIVTDLDADRTTVLVDSMPEWVRDLMDGTGSQRWRAA